MCHFRGRSIIIRWIFSLISRFIYWHFIHNSFIRHFYSKGRRKRSIETPCIPYAKSSFLFYNSIPGYNCPQTAAEFYKVLQYRTILLIVISFIASLLCCVFIEEGNHHLLSRYRYVFLSISNNTVYNVLYIRCCPYNR